jgi:hypothetical protein
MNPAISLARVIEQFDAAEFNSRDWRVLFVSNI